MKYLNTFESFKAKLSNAILEDSDAEKCDPQDKPMSDSEDDKTGEEEGTEEESGE